MNSPIQPVTASTYRIPHTPGNSPAGAVPNSLFYWASSDEVSLDEVIASVGPFWDEADQIAQAFSGHIDAQLQPFTDNLQQVEEGTLMAELRRVYGLFNQESRPEAWFVRLSVEVYLGDRDGWQDDQAADLESWPAPRWPLDGVIEDGSGQTVLLRAVSLKQKHIVQGLLARGADPNLQDIKGCTALHLIAGDSWHLFMLHGLLGAGGDTDIADNRGRTPLHIAIDADNWDGAMALVAAGASVNGLEAHAVALWECAARRNDPALQEKLSALLGSSMAGQMALVSSESPADTTKSRL